MNRNRTRILVAILLFLVLLGASGIQDNPASGQSPSLSITPITWDIIGLDSNEPSTGPRNFPVAARVCNTSAADFITTTSVTMSWTTPSAFIDFRPDTLTTI